MDVLKAVVTESASGEISCSVAETNRIRALLGLKPLRESAPKKAVQVVAPVSAIGPTGVAAGGVAALGSSSTGAASSSGSSLAERILAARERRVAAPASAGSGGLGAGPALKASEWVAHFQPAAGRAGQVKRSVAEQELDVVSSKRARTDDSAMLAGLKVRHNADAFVEGETVDLVLKDRGVLDGSDSEEELVNVGLVDKEKVEEHSRLSKKIANRKYKGYDDDEFTVGGAPKAKSILSKYDEEEVIKPALVISGSGLAVSATDDGDSGRGGAAKPSALSSHATTLEGQVKQQSDYMTKEEMIQFSKPKKQKKKSRKSKSAVSELAFEDDEPAAATAANDGGDDADLGSRNDGRKTHEEQHVEKVMAKRAAYENAVARATATGAGADGAGLPTPAKRTADEILRDLRKQGVGSSGASDGVNAASKHRVYKFVSADDDSGELVQDDAELQASLERARRAAQKAQEKAADPGNDEDADVGAAAVAKALRSISDEMHAATKATGLVFTTTSEFSRNIQARLEETQREEAAAAAARKKKALLENASKALEALKHLPVAIPGVTESADQKEAEDDSDDDDAGNEPLDSGWAQAEPVVSSSMAAALAMLKRQGDLVELESFAGRGNDHKPIDDDIGGRVRLEYRDEFGRRQTPKEAFRGQSYKFHGIKPSKRQQEKKLQRYLQEQQLKRNAGDTPLGTVSALKQQQQSRGQAFLTLAKGGSS